MTEERLGEIEDAFVDLILVGEDGAVLNGTVAELIVEIRRCWAEIEELYKSQGRSPVPFNDPCLGMAGNPEV